LYNIGVHMCRGGAAHRSAPLVLICQDQCGRAPPGNGFNVPQRVGPGNKTCEMTVTFLRRSGAHLHAVQPTEDQMAPKANLMLI
jgi:hypothetical protein